MESQKLRRNVTSVSRSPAMGADTKMKSNIERDQLLAIGMNRPAAGVPATTQKQAPPE
jgi:hypothetical protein